MALTQSILLLNSSYEPLTIIPWQKAICLVLSDKVEVISNYISGVIRTASKTYPLPAVIRLKLYTNRKHTYISSGSAPRRNIYERDAYTCQYCGKTCATPTITIDHVMPKVRGGNNSWINMVTSCKKCNCKKGARTPEEANMPLLHKPIQPKIPWMLKWKNKKIPREWEDYVKKL